MISSIYFIYSFLCLNVSIGFDTTHEMLAKSIDCIYSWFFIHPFFFDTAHERIVYPAKWHLKHSI